MIILTYEVTVLGVNPEVGAPQHVGGALPCLPVHGILEILGGHITLKVLEDHVVVHHDAAGGEGLHLHPLKGLAQG